MAGINSKWINKKNGKTYVVFAQGTDCTNERDGLDVVVYSPEEKYKICVRETKEFYKKFKEI